MSRVIAAWRTAGGCWRALSTQGLRSSDCTPGSCAGCAGHASGLGRVPVMPTSWSSARCLTRRSFSAAICCASTRSYRAWASRESVTVVAPISKLRLAAASCSDTVAFWACTKPSVSCAASMSKRAWLTRSSSSCVAASNCACAMSTARWLCSRLMPLAGRYSGWEASMPTVWVVPVFSNCGRLDCTFARLRPPVSAALGSRPARAWSARRAAEANWAWADCQAVSYLRADSSSSSRLCARAGAHSAAPKARDARKKGRSGVMEGAFAKARVKARVCGRYLIAFLNHPCDLSASLAAHWYCLRFAFAFTNDLAMESVAGQGGVDVLRRGIDTAGDVGHPIEAVLRQEFGHAQAACAVVAQAGDGARRVQPGQACGQRAHGDGEQFKALGMHAGGLPFPGFAHIQHQGPGACGGEPGR